MYDGEESLDAHRDGGEMDSNRIHPNDTNSGSLSDRQISLTSSAQAIRDL